MEMHGETVKFVNVSLVFYRIPSPMASSDPLLKQIITELDGMAVNGYTYLRVGTNCELLCTRS
jgi:hypothetical protein